MDLFKFRKMILSYGVQILRANMVEAKLQIRKFPHNIFFISPEKHMLWVLIRLMLRFYGPVNPMGSCRARSVYLTTRLLGRLSLLSG